MMCQGSAGSLVVGNSPGAAAAQIGLRFLSGGSIGGANSFPLTSANTIMAQVHRLRPSHARGARGHWKRWGDDRMQPVPMRRGIPFRGDRLGSGLTRLSTLG